MLNVLQDDSLNEQNKVFSQRSEEEISKVEEGRLNSIQNQEYIDVVKGGQDQQVGILKDQLKKETKEIVTKSLEFDNTTFKINSDGWEEVTKESIQKNSSLKKFLDKGIKIKANATGDVIEYMEDTVKEDLQCKKGEQLFIFDYRVTFERERFLGYIAKAKGCSIAEVEKKYFLTKKEFEEKMKDKPSHSQEYKQFFREEVNGYLAGEWVPSFVENFRSVGETSSIWLADDYRGAFLEDSWGRNNNNQDYGLSVRLLKN